jgi:5,10-methylenetetrahydromethanopterin reductase
MHPVPGLVNLHDPIQWHMSAMGPRARQLTAELGVEWINFMTAGLPAAVTDLEDMLTKWKAAGRTATPCYTTVFTLGCVLAEKEPYDGPRAKSQAGPLVVTVLQHLINTGERIDIGTRNTSALSSLVAQYQQIYDAYEPKDTRYMQLYRGHLMWLLPEEEHLISGDLIGQLTLTGTVAELRKRIRLLRDAGYRQLTIQLVPGQEDALDDWARVIEGV